MFVDTTCRGVGKCVHGPLKRSNKRLNTLVFLPVEATYHGTRKHYSVVKVLSGLYHLDRMPSRGYALDMEKKPKPSALTVRFTAEEKAILTDLRAFYGLSS